ncbi:MAG: hypothetical protein U1F16_13420 [Turneriella sp.]
MRLSTLLAFLLGFAFPLSARHYYVLGGFKIGQKLSDVKVGFPKMKKLHQYPDGVEVFGFMNGEVQVLLETHPRLPDLVWSIQISGTANPTHYGLENTNLGLPVSELIRRFGKPLETKEGFHEILKKPFKAYHYYSADNNFSFEAIDDRVNSIKIMLSAEPQADLPDWSAFLTAVREKNYYRIAEMTDPDCILELNGKKAPIQGALVEVLQKNPIYIKLLFDNKTGLASLKDSDLKNGVMRMFESGRSGMVVFAHGNVKKEIVFIRGLTGFGLWELNALRAGQE